MRSWARNPAVATNSSTITWTLTLSSYQYSWWHVTDLRQSHAVLISYSSKYNNILLSTSAHKIHSFYDPEARGFLFLDSRTSRVFPKPKQTKINFFQLNFVWGVGEPKPQTAAYSTSFGSFLLYATLIQAFSDIESVCERYWVWILNIKSAIKLRLWTLHSKDCTALHDVKFKFKSHSNPFLEPTGTKQLE